MEGQDGLVKIAEEMFGDYAFLGEDTELDSSNSDVTEEKLINLFHTKKYEPYLVKMIRAEIGSSYPKLGTYEGEGNKDEQGNQKDKDDDYVAQGIAQIKRTKMNEDGSVGEEIDLKYIPNDEFDQLVTDGDSSVLNYYTYDISKGAITYATYSKTVHNGEVESYTIRKNSVSYKSVTSTCSMPFDFLFALLQESECPDYVSAVVELLLQDSELVIMIQDSLNVSRLTEVKSSVLERDVKAEDDSTGALLSYSVDFDYGTSVTDVTETYSNSAKMFIQKANTWCLKFEQEAVSKVTENIGTAQEKSYNYSDFASMSFGRDPVKSVVKSGGTTTTTLTYQSNEMVTLSTRTDNYSYTWDINVKTEKEINYEKFLGQWKNKKGKYGIGEDYLFDEDGKKVVYKMPNDEKAKVYPPDNLSEDGKEVIAGLLQLLSYGDDIKCMKNS